MKITNKEVNEIIDRNGFFPVYHIGRFLSTKGVLVKRQNRHNNYLFTFIDHEIDGHKIDVCFAFLNDHPYLAVR